VELGFKRFSGDRDGLGSAGIRAASCPVSCPSGPGLPRGSAHRRLPRRGAAGSAARVVPVTDAASPGGRVSA
jgi:hypothetical protein